MCIRDRDNLARGCDAVAADQFGAHLQHFARRAELARAQLDHLASIAPVSYTHLDVYKRQGYAFASINYRLVPAATVEEQAADVAAAVQAIVERADALGVDRHRIVLMGHSAGAHLVALVGTDPRYLKGAGLSFADIAGVIPIDGAAYDLSLIHI